MSTPRRPAPALDPEAGAPWLEASATTFAGGGMRVDAETLEFGRSLEMTDIDALLRHHRYGATERQIPGPDGAVALSVFTPDGHSGPAPGLLWIHGGGMVMGDRSMVDEALDLAATVGAVVVSVDYRLAPEHPAPAPVDDCFAALHWFAQHAEELGVDAGRIVLGGASAGGGIAAATALRVRDEGGPHLVGLFLCCPMLDDRMTTVSANQFGDALIWTQANNDFGWRCLLGERIGTDDVSIYEAPARAIDLSGLPPTLIDVGSVDLFRDEDVAFASTMWASGGDAELHVWSGAYHGSEALAPLAALTADAREVRHRWMRRKLAKL